MMCALLLLIGALEWASRTAVAQGLTDFDRHGRRTDQGGVLAGAVARVSSPCADRRADHNADKPEGAIALSDASSGTIHAGCRAPGIPTFHEEHISVGPGGTIEEP